MSIWLLSNEVGHAAAHVVATDASAVETSDQTKIGAILGGPPHLKYTSEHATAGRRLSYINKTNKLTANFCVVSDAKAHVGKTQKVIASSTYPSVEATLDNRVLSTSDFVGVDSSAFVFQFSSTSSNQEAFSVEYSDTDYQKTARQIYFCQGIELTDTSDIVPITSSRAPHYDPPMIYEGKAYHLWGSAELRFTCVTRSVLNRMLELPQYDPVFLYDDNGNGIAESLWRVIIEDMVVEPDLDDDHNVTLQVAIIREWGDR